MTTARTRRALAATVLAVALLAGACSASGDESSTKGGDAPTTTTGKGSGSKDTGTLDWKDCDGGFQCATLEVPVDYEEPDGKKLELAMARRPAKDPKERIGSLFVNPGGPGGSAIDTIEGLPLPGDITAHFDIVGFDPRGVGRSTPLDCHSHLQEMYDADPTMEDQADKTYYLKVSKEYVDECAKKYKDLLPHLGTQNVARDMDEVRKAVGDEKLTYLGYSYGTSIGQQYAQLFPTHIRAMVLDGVVDTDATGLDGAAFQADGFELALKTFLADCKSKPSCAIGPDPTATLKRVIAKAEKEPIPSQDADRPATPGVVQLGIGQALYARELWAQLSQALHDADEGDGSGLVQLADEYLQRNPDGSYGNGFDIYFAVSCLDSSWPRSPEAFFDAAKKVGQKDPFLGEGLVNDYVRCALWPTPPQPLPKVTAKGSPTIVVISTTRDPATPYQAGVDVAERLPKGVLISNDGDGHTIFAQGKSCVDDAVTTYFVDLKAPKDGLTC